MESGLIFCSLTTKFLGFPSLTLDFGLIGVDLPLLICLPDLLSLELVADQRASPQSKGAADRCPYAGCADRRADDSADRCATQCADASAFLTRC